MAGTTCPAVSGFLSRYGDGGSEDIGLRLVFRGQAILRSCALRFVSAGVPEVTGSMLTPHGDNFG